MRYWTMYIALCCSITILGADWWPLPMDSTDTQQDSLTYQVAVSATIGTGQYNAFWMQSNQRGCASMAANSGTLHLGIAKESTRPYRWYDYDIALEVYGVLHSPLSQHLSLEWSRIPMNQGRNGMVTVHKACAHVRLYIIDIAAGIIPIDDGMNTPLSSGSLLLSHNAPSMPTIRIGIDRWTAIPGSFGYAEIKGGLVHAWLNDNVYMHGCKLHYKYIGLRLGGRLPINISYDFHHAAQWGGYLSNGVDLGNKSVDFWHAILAKSGGSSYNEYFNAQGNHLGSQQITLTTKGSNWEVCAYWQNLLDDNFAFIATGHNLPDGRWGITFAQSKWSYINRLTMEYVGTTDQTGPWHDQDAIIYAGHDNYYCNGIYKQGWNYYCRTLGTPLITSPIYNEDGYLQTKNNRIKAWHIGIGGDIEGFKYYCMGTYIQNYGRYSDKAYWYNMQNYNLALLLDIRKTIPKAWGLEFGLRIAADIGTQWKNQVSTMFTITKKGILTTYK